jgi:hypothetical protein
MRVLCALLSAAVAPLAGACDRCSCPTVKSPIVFIEHLPGRGSGPLVSPRPAHTDWHHTRQAPPRGNGRLWEGGVVTRDPTPAIDRTGPGPEHYGAHRDDHSSVHARVGRAIVVFSAWDPPAPVRCESTLDLRRPGRAALERRPDRVTTGFSSPVRDRIDTDLRRARDAWLREEGYTGGVRTFRNPAPRNPDIEQGSAEPVPAGWFRAPPEMPRTRSREQVRYSLPPGMDPASGERLRRAHTGEPRDLATRR